MRRSAFNMRRSILASFLISVLIASAQQAPAPQGPTTFKSTVQLVVIDVTAKDKSGNPIEGLTEKDFTITEDGKPQEIKVFKFQKLEEETLPEPTLTPRPAPK